MGEQHSKTSNQRQSTDCSSTESEKSFSQKCGLLPMSCSPQKMRQISKSKKIRTTCVLKSSQKPSISTAPNSQEDTFLSVLNKIAHHFQQREKKETSQQQDEKRQDTQNQSGHQPMDADIDRINGLFNFSVSNINKDEFKHQEDRGVAQIQKWRASVKIIMHKLSGNFQYRQGHLLICAILRLYFDQILAYEFLYKILQKIGSLLSLNQQYQKFAQDLTEKCFQKCPRMKERLIGEDLDFQFIYLSWILGMFTSILEKQVCIRVWFQLVKSQKPFQIVQLTALRLMSSIQACLRQMEQINPEKQEKQENLRGRSKREAKNLENPLSLGEIVKMGLQLGNQNPEKLIKGQKIRLQLIINQ